MNKKTVTLQDIAREAGVSMTTVSHVINKTRHVAQETRELVLRALEDLDYRHSESRQHRPVALERIGVITANIQEDYYLLLVKTIETIASENNISVLICDSEDDAQREQENIAMMRAKGVEGLIIAPIAFVPYPTSLSQADIPIVLVDRQYQDHNTTFVGINNSESAQKGVHYLVQKGCRNIAFVGYEESVYTMQQRVLGYRFGILQDSPTQSDFILHVKYSKEDSHHKIADFLQAHEPDGVICGTSDLCYQLISVVDDLKIAVPETLKILTYDDNKWLDYLKYPVSVITQPAPEIAYQAVESLISAYEQQRFTRKNKTEILFDVQIIDRLI